MKFFLTGSAGADLRSICRYTLQTWGAGQEQKYIDRIWKKFNDIRENPTRYRLRNDLFPGCRTAREGKHIILFRIADDRLEITRVLHTSMDFPRHLPD